MLGIALKVQLNVELESGIESATKPKAEHRSWCTHRHPSRTVADQFGQQSEFTFGCKLDPGTN